MTVFKDSIVSQWWSGELICEVVGHQLIQTI